MSEDFLPKSDSDIVRWAANFVTVATANMTTINFTAGQVNTLQTQNITFNSQITLVDSKREEYHAAVQSKDAARRIVISTAREYNKLVQSRVSVPNALKVQLGLRPRSSGKKVTPEVPTAVTVTGNSLGNNTITWKRNGNLPGTSFEVWKLSDPDMGWEFLAATNRVALTSKGNIPGVKTYYRVRSRRREEYSAFSDPAVIYAGESASSILLSKAA